MRHYTSDAFFVTSDNHQLCKLKPRPLIRGRGFVDNFIYK